MKYLIVCTIGLLFTGALLGQAEYPLETILQKGHTGLVSAYDFSPGQKYLATGSRDNSIILWNLENGREIRIFSRHTDKVRSVRFSPDGERILSASADNTARVFEVVSGDQVFVIRLDRNELMQAFYSADGSKIIPLDNRYGLFVYDAGSGKRINTFSRDYGQMSCDHVLDPSASRILSAGSYKEFYVCSVPDADTLLTIPFDKAYQLSFSADGKYIAASSSKLFTKVFDASSGKELYDLRYGTEQCDGCNTRHVFSNSGRFLVTMSGKVDAILWDLSTGKMVRSFTDLRERPYSLVFTADDSHVLLSFDEEVFVYDVKSGKEKLHATSEAISGFEFRFDPGGGLIVLPGENNEVLVWDISSGRKKKTLQGYLNRKKDDGLRYNNYSWTDQSILNYIRLKRDIALSPDNRHLVIGNIDSSAMVIDLETGKMVHQLRGHRQVVFAMEYSPDGKVIATAGGDRKIKLWDATTGEELWTLTGHRELVFDLAFNSDGTELVSGSWDGTLRIWDLKNPGEYQAIDLGNNSPYTVGFTPNNLYAVTGNLDREVDFWEVDAGRSFRTLIGHTGILAAFDFNPDGKTMVSASWDGKVKWWDVLTGMLIGKMEEHEGQVCAVAWDPKGRFVASAGSDNTIIGWDPVTNSFPFRLRGHSSPVTSLAFTSDGKKLVSCSVDGTVKVWELEQFTELYSRIQISRDEWLATAPNGSFDGSAKSLEMVNYVSGLEVIPVGSLFDKYHTPGLISRITNGEKLNDSGLNLDELIRDTPLIAFELPTTMRSLDNDSVYLSKSGLFEFGLRINSQGRSIEEIRIYNNGKLVIRESFSTDLVFRGGEKDVRRFEIPLSDGENLLRAVVLNSDRTESGPAELSVRYDGIAAFTDLFILSIGINQYKNPQYNLDYAVNDARSFVATVTAGADSLFNSIIQYAIHDEQATRENITKVMEEISQKAGPEDVFIFFYAGHGVMSFEKNAGDADFFIVTHDVTNLYGETATLRQKAVSAAELMRFSMAIPAAKQLFILDACHSGGALDAFASRGDGRELALAQLARSTGTFFLTASQDAQYANEAGDLEHGLFTYALLEILSGQSGGNGDAKITINELKLYVEDRVPELSQQYHGSVQYPTSYSFGQDFPIVIIR